jgi:hypothetical protein
MRESPASYRPAVFRQVLWATLIFTTAPHLDVFGLTGSGNDSHGEVNVFSDPYPAVTLKTIPPFTTP